MSESMDLKITVGCFEMKFSLLLCAIYIFKNEINLFDLWILKLT